MSGSDPKDSAEPAKPHLGDLVRKLRETAGLTRRFFGEQVKLSEAVVKAFETGRLRLSAEQLQRILRHPAMADLHWMALAAGLEPPKEPG